MGILLAGFVPKASDNSIGPIAIVELFTSEGCSSCPAAEELLKEMTELIQREGKNVLALSFHVTYWNRLGWNDPYSQEIFTLRQKKYAEALKVEAVYTPQAIVNGEREFVGSNPIAFREAIESGLSQTQLYAIQAKAQIKDKKLFLSYQIDKEPKNAVLNVALTENYIEHRVLRGENKDKTLRHYKVVLNFKTVELHKQDTVSIDLHENLNLSSTEVVLFAQHKKSMRILGASKIALLESED